MDLSFPLLRMRAFHGQVRRLLTGAATATLLLVAVPAPAVAAPTPSITISDVTVTEGTGGTVNANFTIQAAPAQKIGAGGLQVSWATAPGTATAPGDFTAASGTAALTRSNPSRVVSVPVIGDALNETTETFVVNLSNLVGSPGTIGDAQGVATITDDDPVPVLSVNDVSVTEGNVGTATATFTVTLSAASGKAVTFNWATAAGSATAGTDYVAASGSRTMAVGATTATVGITVNGDLADELDETFGITLSSPGNATIGDGSGLATISDDDPVPVLSVNDVSVPEGDAGTTTATFTVTLSAASGKAVNFDWTTTGGTATAGVDYVAASGSKTIAAGLTNTTVGITVNGDVVDEANENFGITLSTPGNATIGDGSGVDTITDDDAAPTLSVNDVTVTEGNAGTTTATFTVSLSAVSANPVTFDWTTSAGSATAGVDYVAASGSKTIAAGSTTTTFAVTVNGDVLDEANETYGITLSNPGNATIADGSGLGTITDDDAAPTLSVNDVTVLEGNAGTSTATFTVTLSPVSGQAVTFDWATAAGSATAGVDYVVASGSRTIAAGSTTTTFGITVKGDVLDELDETFGITLSNPGNATIADGSGLGTITDDDVAPTLSVNDATVTEGNVGTTPATFTVTLSAASGTAVTFDWATAAGSATAGVDYVAASGSKTIAAGSTTTTFAVIVNGDVLDEANETYGVTLSNPGNATIADGSGLGTITDDDAAPTLSVNDVTVTEGNAGTSTATFAVTLSAASAKTVTVDWTTANASAMQPSDYLAGSGILTFVPGDTSESIDITVNGDVVDEANETYGVTLSNPGNATIADGSGLGTITDDDAAPTLSVNDVTVTEGNAGTMTATFTVTLSAASGQAVTFDWASSAGSATAGTDYVTASGSRTIAAGATTATVDITVNGDVLDELDETFGITLSNPGNATVADGSGLGTITDDDAAPTLSVNDVTVVEGNAGTTTATFTVTLSAASGQTITVNWATADDMATQPSDYTAVSGLLTFVPGDTSETLGVTVKGDIVAELDETFLVALTSPSNAVLADPQGLGTIQDDELLPVIDIDEPSIVEGQSGTSFVSFSVTLSHPSAAGVTVDWTTTPGTATPGTDYVAASGTVTFASLDTSETVSIIVKGDGTFERDETFALDLSNTSGPPIGDVQGIATIANDDTAPIASVTDVSKAEGNTGTSLLTFVVSLSGGSDVDASFDFATANATATASTDYVAVSGALTIAAGATTGTVHVVVNGDVTYESNETLSLTLSNPTGASIGDGVAQGTITNDDKAPTTLTLRVVRKPRAVVAKGILEPATSGEHVSVTLLRKQGGKFVKVAAKTVSVRYLKDRDGDGKTDGSYTATFTRPKTKGSYKVITRFKGTATYKPRSLGRAFTLASR